MSFSIANVRCEKSKMACNQSPRLLEVVSLLSYALEYPYARGPTPPQRPKVLALMVSAYNRSALSISEKVDSVPMI